MVILSLIMVADAGGFGLPQMSEAEMLERLLSGDSGRSDKEPEIASSIGEQMLLMGLRTMPRSLRVRIRDITSRVPLGNAILVGGGIGHLSAWLFDLWCAEPTDEKQSIDLKPDSFIIVEEGARFGVIIDRLIKRYNAETWSRVVAKPWSEITAEVTSWSAAAASLPSSCLLYTSPSPRDIRRSRMPSSA